MLSVAAVLLIVACGADSQAARAAAINAVALSQEFGNPRSTPPPRGDYECEINVGGPQPTPLPGVCRWDAARDGDGWIVSATQTWRCEDFSGSVQGYPDCTGETGSHTWRHRVDEAGEITFLDSEGQFPPSLAE